MPCPHTYDPKLALQMTQHEFWQRSVQHHIKRRNTIFRRLRRIPLVFEFAALGSLAYDLCGVLWLNRLAYDFCSLCSAVPDEDRRALMNCKCWHGEGKQNLI